MKNKNLILYGYLSFTIILIISLMIVCIRFNNYKSKHPDTIISSSIDKSTIDKLEKQLDDKNKELEQIKEELKHEIKNSHDLSDSDAVVLFKQLLSE